MEGPKIKILPLNENPHFITKTAELLNIEWPRSISARLRSLGQSSSTRLLPISLIMVDEEDERVIGHSRLTGVPSDPRACFIESVVIHPTLRGRGYGKILMSESEKYAQKIGIEIIHLTTHDQQGFYSKLGYEISEPIVIYGLATTSILEKIDNLKIRELDESREIENMDAVICNSQIDIEIKYEPDEVRSFNSPPPPPMPKNLTPITNKTFMKKVLNSCK